ncbi:MAG TPA: glycosyltransferase family 2 protein [Bryobacteraceae bacterium]|nr:glycosyltransferase family 2 protein [Bryobacteraceae bacterium]
MKLLIAIPALNEEDSIESTIARSLEAREHICRNAPVDEVEITVVSDGSTDRTVERAGKYTDQIKLIVFPQNKGYGAAIKEAWRQSDADLLAFLDADGTCDPNFFAALCAHLIQRDADVVLGCRLNQDSQMPAIRRLGNAVFAVLLSLFSSSRVRDTASGMRVVRRSSLGKLFPLPDGLHFTPAMSARAMLSDTVRIVEIDMPYHERAGESKLRVARDGMRFLKVIVEAAFLYRPARLLGMMSAILFLAAAVLMAQPTWYYVQHRAVPQWMIYRFLVSDLFGIGAVLLFSASYLAYRMVSIALTHEVTESYRHWSALIFRSRWFWFLPAAFTAVGAALVWHSVLQRLRTGGTYEHWSHYVVMTFFFSAALILLVTRGIEYVLSLVAERVQYLNRSVLREPRSASWAPARLAAVSRQE